MTIDATNAAAPSLYTTATPATDAKKTMDQEVFLSLLVAQLRNQDPTSPMDTTEMMSQSTQLASMEALNGMADVSRESFSLQMRIAATGMVGQTVSWFDADGSTRSGTATAVSFAGATPTVLVGDTEVPLDLIAAVRQAGATPTTSPVPADPTDPTDLTDPTDPGIAAGGDTTTAA